MKYFAYGSNMDEMRMKERGVSFSSRFPAKLPAYALRFDKTSNNNPEEGFANITAEKESEVEGVVYEITKEGFNLLDGFEKFPEHYRKINVSVIAESGESVEATAYIANDDKTAEGLKPSKDYMNHLMNASDCLSESYLKKLRSVEILD